MTQTGSVLIYNTSFHLEGETLIGPFLCYMRDEYLPQVEQSPYLSCPRFVRLLTDVGEGVFAYSLMCDCPDVVALKKWRKETGDRLLADLHARFGQKILTFNTTMKEIVP